MSKYTEAQALAIEGLRETQVVTAGAGSGKTTVLVQRYLNLIDPFRADGPCAAPGEVLAITFTNKAAQEMKDRVRAQLAERAANASDAAERRGWNERRDALGESPITTFHSFCASIVREHPVEAGIDPAATVLAEHEAALELNSAITRAMTRNLATDGALAVLLSKWDPKSAAAAIGSLLRQVRGAGWSFAQVSLPAAAAGTHPDRADVNRLAHQIRQSAQAVQALSGLSGASSEMLAAFKTRVPELEAALITCEAGATGATAEASLFSIEAAVKLIGGNCAKALKEAAAPLREAVDELARALAEEQGAACLRSILQLARESERLYREAKDRARALDYEDLLVLARDLLRSNAGVLDTYRQRFRFVLIDEFQDTDAVQDEIVSLLTGSRNGTDSSLFIVGDPKQSIYRFRHAEVALFEARRAGCQVENGAGARGEPRRALSLADNFRTRPQVLHFVNAVFERLMGDTPAQVSFEPLLPRRACRGRAPAVEFLAVDASGGRSTEASRLEAQELAERLKAIVTAGRAEEETWRVKLATRRPDLQAERVQALSRALAGRSLLRQGLPAVLERGKGHLGERPRPARYADIALLLRTRSRLKEFEAALAAAGVPFYVVGGTGFYERQEVLDLLSVLRCIDDCSDAVSLLAALRSPLFGLTDDTLLRLVQTGGDLWRGLAAPEPPSGVAWDQAEACRAAFQTITRCRGLRSRLPVLELVDLILRLTGFEHVLAELPGGRQMVANVRRLRELAWGLASKGVVELGDFLAEVKLRADAAREGEAPVETEGSDAVKILTVHSAKGLEFPVVVVGDSARVPEPPHNSSHRVSWSVRHGLGLRFPWAGKARETRAFTEQGAFEKAADQAESVRLLYVALTRARDYLLITGFEKDGRQGTPADSWHAQLKAILPDLGGPNLVRCTGSAHCAVPDTTPIAVGSGEGADVGPATPIHAAGSPAEKAAEPALSVVLGETSAPERQIIRYSLSEVQSYQLCPQRYYYQYRLRVPPVEQALRDEPAPHEIEPGSDATDELVFAAADMDANEQGAIDPRPPGEVVGSAVHWVIERLRGRHEVEGLIREALAAHGLTGEVAADRVRRLVGTYVASREFEAVSGQAADTVLSEVPLVCRLDPRTVVTGVADRLVHLPDGKVRLVDFKTNAVPGEAVAEAVQKYRLQLPIYALALREAGLTVEDAVYAFLWPGVWHRADVSQDALARVQLEVAALCRAMEADTQFAGLPGKHCGHCGYRPLCGQTT